MYKLTFFVPVADKEMIKMELFKAGAGRLGSYDSCCFESLGTGQFRPLLNSKPYIGEENTLEFVQEYRVEMIVLNSLIKKIIEVLIQVHPYEEPAYDVVKLESF